MAYNPNNINGQALMTDSTPVVIASNQSSVTTNSNGTIFTFSTVNSTTAQLASGATFTGTVEVVTNNQSYSILLVSDQPGTITVNQYIDAGGTKLAQTISYLVAAGIGFARSGVMNGNYFKLTFINSGTATTTTLQIDTAFGTMPASTQLNNLPVSINEVNGVAIPINSGVPITLPNGTMDTFGKIQTVNAINDIDIPFFKDVPDNLVVVTTTGGSATAVTGLAQFATSTSVTGAAKGVTSEYVCYRAGGEIYAMFTAAWLDGGAATSYQRIGLYDIGNGFFIGYENTTFGITIRLASGDTQTSKANFNTDTLTGKTTSRFTRLGVPEAIDLTKLNVFKIRFGWLGAAPIRFDVLSPDGDWVNFHTIKQPNLSATPSIQNVDLPMTLDMAKTAGATNLRMNTACWGAGSTYDKTNHSNSGTLGTAVNSFLNITISEVGTLSFRVGTTTTGTFALELTADGTNWITTPEIMKTSTTIDAGISGNITPTAGDIYKISTTGWRGCRVRTITTLGATVSLFFTFDEHSASIRTYTQIKPRTYAYRCYIPKQAAGASKVYFDIFNASGSNKIIKLLSVVPMISGAVAVVGVVGVDLHLTKTTAVGTGGTTSTFNGTDIAAMTITSVDSNNTALPAGITGRLSPAGGATAGAVCSWASVFTEETNSSTYLGQFNDLARRNQIDTQMITLNEGQGFRVVQGTVASVGNIGFDIIIEVE